MNAITTGLVRLSYCSLNAKREKTGKFETGAIIPKTDKATIAKIEKMIEAAYANPSLNLIHQVRYN